MNIIINKDSLATGRAAAEHVARKLNEAVSDKGEARLVVSTGSSQFELFEALIKKEIDWRKIEIFHLDEYIGLPVTHKASFRKYLYERFVNHITPGKFYPVDVEGDIDARIRDLGKSLTAKPVDVGLIGIGVNGHVAFNDPPADFDISDPYIVVNLDNQCKLQQVNEGWFGTIDDVPSQAVSMSVRQIMKCKTIISVVPHKVKADAISKTFRNRLTNTVPATILKQHPDYHLYLDYESASEVITF